MRYEEYLEQNGSMTYSNVGVSMMPLLKQGRDLFTVKKKGKQRCKKYDVVLYRRPPSHYVLHRVIKVRAHDYVILGDNCMAREYGIRDEDILAVMVSFVRNGREHSVEESACRLYTFIWLHTAPARIFMKKIILRLRKTARRLSPGRKR
jgi:hypothetical protein